MNLHSVESLGLCRVVAFLKTWGACRALARALLFLLFVCCSMNIRQIEYSKSRYDGYVLCEMLWGFCFSVPVVFVLRMILVIAQWNDS